MDTATATQNFPLETYGERQRQRHQAAKQDAWRQREEDERGLEAAHAKLQAKLVEKNAAAKVLEKEKKAEAFLRKQCYEFKLQNDEIQRKRAEAKAIKDAAKEEKERLRLEEVERDRQRRAPWTCEDCSGCGKCVSCNGNGCHKALFLSGATVDHSVTIKEFGVKPQGCYDCYGWAPGIHGKFVKGSGKCGACQGHGKIWPVIKEKAAVINRRGSRLPQNEERPATPETPKQGNSAMDRLMAMRNQDLERLNSKEQKTS